MTKTIRLYDFLKRIDLPLIGLFFVGLFLRCINLSSRSIQYDDAFSFFLARQDWQAIIKGTAADTMPPLYYFLLHLWLQISDEIAWLRLLSILFSLLSIFFLYRIVEMTADRRAGLWAVFFTVISPLQIYHAQDLRMYALLAAVQLGYLFFFLRISTLIRVPWTIWCGLIFCGTAAMYSHNLAIFILTVPDLVLLVKREWKKLLKLLMAQVAIGVLSLPWLLMVPGQVDKIQRSFWTPQPGLVEVLQAVLVMTTNLPLEGIWFVIGAVISIELLVIIIWLIIRNRAKNTGFLLWVCLLPPTLLFLISYLMRPVFISRGFITSTIVYLGLAGIVVAQSKKRVIWGLLVGGFSLAAMIALPYQLSFEQFPRSSFAPAMQAIRTNFQLNEIIVHDNKLSFFPAYYYAPDLVQRFIVDEPGSPNDTYAAASQQAIGLIPSQTVGEAVGDARGVYFVTFQKTIEEYQAAGLAHHPNLSWFSSKFQLMDQTVYGDLWIYYFRLIP